MRTQPARIARAPVAERLAPHVWLVLLTLCLAPFAQAQHVIFGTGFFVNEGGDALTNAHVLRNCEPDAIIVRTNRGEWQRSRLLSIDAEFDIASLATGIQTHAFAAVRVVPGTTTVSIPDPPEDIFTAGFDDLGDEAFALQLRWGQAQPGTAPNEFPFLNIMRNASAPGSSGSPVLDYNGLLLGIVFARTQFPAQDLDGLSRAGYGDRWVVIHNNNAIVQYANRTGLRIYAWDKWSRLDPIRIAQHLGDITIQIACLPR